MTLSLDQMDNFATRALDLADFFEELLEYAEIFTPEHEVFEEVHEELIERW